MFQQVAMTASLGENERLADLNTGGIYEEEEKETATDGNQVIANYGNPASYSLLTPFDQLQEVHPMPTSGGFGGKCKLLIAPAI